MRSVLHRSVLYSSVEFVIIYSEIYKERSAAVCVPRGRYQEDQGRRALPLQGYSSAMRRICSGLLIFSGVDSHCTSLGAWQQTSRASGQYCQVSKKPAVRENRRKQIFPILDVGETGNNLCRYFPFWSFFLIWATQRYMFKNTRQDMGEQKEGAQVSLTNIIKVQQ